MVPVLVDMAYKHNEYASSATVRPLKQASTVVTDMPLIPSPTTASLPNVTIPVRHPSLITQEFDLLRFEAAAFDQLPKAFTSQDQASVEKNSTDLISSPYNHPGHYLSLPSLPLSSQLFAKALTALRPVVPDYATAEYTHALNFDDVLGVLRDLVQQQEPSFVWTETSFYVVIFRSKLKPNIDNDWLYKLDYESHREACESGGLLKYWFGKSNAERRNLATCFWHSRADAYQGGLGPWHKKARAAGRELYESIDFTTHRFTVLDGVLGYRFEAWK